MIGFKHKGDFEKTTEMLEKIKRNQRIRALDKYGQAGVDALASVTPRDTGLTASSWYYEIIESEGRTTITFNNSNIQNGIPIAIILQVGHATRNGSWVEGIDYINPALRPIFDTIADAAWKEVIGQ